MASIFDNVLRQWSGQGDHGSAIQDLGWKCSNIVVSTKIFWGGPGQIGKGLSRKHIVEGTEASLKQLDMEYVDVIKKF